MSDEPVIITRDPAPYWSNEEVGVLTALSAAEVREDQGGKPYSWHPLVPVGEFHHPKFGMLKFDADDVTEFAANFRAGVRGADIPVDEVGAHESTPGGAAYGWLEQVEARPDGLWGRIGWNKQGQEVLADDAYRYISPTLHTKDLPFTARDGSKVGNVVRSICLTNRPVFKGQPQLQVSMSEYTTEDETGAEDAAAAATPAVTVSMAVTDERSEAMSEDTITETTTEEATVEAAEPENAVAAITAERDELLAQVQTLTDRVAELEQATTVTAAETVQTAETPEALELAETKRRLQVLEDERAIELSEREFGEAEFDGSRRLGKADAALYARVYRALPEALAAQFAEHVKGGGASYVQFGEVGMVASGSRKPAPQKLYEDAVKADEDAQLPETTVAAIVKFGEGKAFESFDELYAAWAADGKPGVK